MTNPITCSMTIPFYSDAGHGWAKVHRDTLADFGIEDKITSYSYQRGSWAYLEEDLDVSTLFKAAAEHGVAIKWKEMKPAKTYSRIRTYEHYSTWDGTAREYRW